MWRIAYKHDFRFNYADKMDKEGNFGKNVVKAFYTSGHLFDILATFGELDEGIQVVFVSSDILYYF